MDSQPNYFIQDERNSPINRMKFSRMKYICKKQRERVSFNLQVEWRDLNSYLCQIFVSLIDLRLKNFHCSDRRDVCKTTVSQHEARLMWL